MGDPKGAPERRNELLGYRLFRNAKNKIIQFDTNVITNKYEQLFEGVMDENKKINKNVKCLGL